MNDYPKLVCTIQPDVAPGQAMAWTDLRNKALRTERLDHGIAITLDIALADEVDDLAGREAACCGFLTLTTTRNEHEVRLEVVSENPDAMPFIETILGSP